MSGDSDELRKRTCETEIEIEIEIGNFLRYEMALKSRGVTMIGDADEPRKMRSDAETGNLLRPGTAQTSREVVLTKLPQTDVLTARQHAAHRRASRPTAKMPTTSRTTALRGTPRGMRAARGGGIAVRRATSSPAM